MPLTVLWSRTSSYASENCSHWPSVRLLVLVSLLIRPLSTFTASHGMDSQRVEIRYAIPSYGPNLLLPPCMKRAPSAEYHSASSMHRRRSPSPSLHSQVFIICCLMSIIGKATGWACAVNREWNQFEAIFVIGDPVLLIGRLRVNLPFLCVFLLLLLIVICQVTPVRVFSVSCLSFGRVPDLWSKPS